ncbi:MAG TPA: head GIN domain-containing protein [Chitinophagaceae bacterium]|nr:head GIN domain-containing protein [Chitinophagaceae bacterium]
MKKLIMAIGAWLMLGTLAAQEVNDPNAEVREAKNFHAIRISNAFDVYLTQGNDEVVAVSAADPDVRSRIHVEVEGGVLSIWLDGDKKFWKGWNSGKMKLRAYISFRSLDKLTASGACDVNLVGVIKSDDLKIDLSGASDLKGKLDIGKLDVQLSGASDMTVSGTASQLKADLSGACDFKGYDLETDFCDVSASGASGMKITVNKELSARLSGASDMNYKGNGLIRDIKTSGASKVSRKS